jgi:hypothetical protein
MTVPQKAEHPVHITDPRIQEAKLKLDVVRQALADAVLQLHKVDADECMGYIVPDYIVEEIKALSLAEIEARNEFRKLVGSVSTGVES